MEAIETIINITHIGFDVNFKQEFGQTTLSLIKDGVVKQKQCLPNDDSHSTDRRISDCLIFMQNRALEISNTINDDK